MRIDAAVSVRTFLDAVEEEDLDPLRPLVPQLLQQFLTLSNEVRAQRPLFVAATVVGGLFGGVCTNLMLTHHVAAHAVPAMQCRLTTRNQIYIPAFLLNNLTIPLFSCRLTMRT